MSSDSKHISRRALVANMGYGLAAATLTGSAAAAQNQGSTTAPMVDPKSKYPKPSLSGSVAALAGSGKQDEPEAGLW